MSTYTEAEAKQACERACRRAIRDGYDEVLAVYLLGFLCYEDGPDKVDEVAAKAKLWVERNRPEIAAAKGDA